MPQEFVKVAQTGELSPGQMKAAMVGDEEILLINIEGSYHAISDTCTHAYASLSEGDLSGEEVECFLQWQPVQRQVGRLRDSSRRPSPCTAGLAMSSAAPVSLCHASPA